MWLFCLRQRFPHQIIEHQEHKEAQGPNVGDANCHTKEGEANLKKGTELIDGDKPKVSEESRERNNSKDDDDSEDEDLSEEDDDYFSAC
jgi:mono/diheme cytochrome c family protein